MSWHSCTFEECYHPSRWNGMTEQAKKLYLSANNNLPAESGVVYSGSCFWEAIAKQYPQAETYQETQAWRK